MFRFIHLLLVFTLIFSGCSSFVDADRAAVVFSQAHDFGATAIAFSPDSSLLVSGGHKGDLRLWDMNKKAAITELPAHSGVVRAIQFISSKAFVSGAEDGKLILWDGAKIKTDRSLSPVSSLSSIHGRLISGHSDGWLRTWDFNLKELASLKLDRPVIAISSHLNTLAVGLKDQIMILDSNLNILNTLNNEGGLPHDLQFSPDGKTLAAGNWFTLSTWNVATGKQEIHPTEHHGLVTSVSFSPDGREIATLGRHTDSAIRIVNTETFQVERRYQAHELCGAMVRFSPNGHWMASASDDESIRLYDLSKAYNPRSAASLY